jgi:hypothetical protein
MLGFLSILSQLPPKASRRPVSIPAATTTPLSILSQLPRRRQRVGVQGQAKDFQFFPSCRRAFGLTEEGWRFLEAFNSFPVAAASAPPRPRRSCWRSFNSFPVAAGELSEEEKAVAALSFNSFPVAASGATPGSTRRRCFQFFPSCRSARTTPSSS